MGYTFDDNGRYVGWSNLFDLSNIDTLKASEYLPIPNGVTYTRTSDGLDITEDIRNIVTKLNKAELIKAYADLLIKLGEANITYSDKGKRLITISWNDTVPEDIGNGVLFNLNSHSNTYLSPRMLEDCLKNSVSSSITNIIQNLRNMDLAYSPIEMDKVRNAAKLNPRNKSTRMTLMNPLTKFLMQELNMVGKGVIGIAAVGEKVFFNVSHYWNEGLRRRDETWIKNMQFSLTFDRILGRSKNNITSVTKTTLANVNFEGVEDLISKFVNINAIQNRIALDLRITDIDRQNNTTNYQLFLTRVKKEIKNKLGSYTYADDIISLLLSAATDNAKELILALINAGTDLARCYLHLIMMGFDINDIASFMISPVVSTVKDLATSNMFDEYLYDVRIDEAINTLKGDFPIYRFFTGLVQIEGNRTSYASLAFSKLNSLLRRLKEIQNLRNQGKTEEEKEPIKTYKNLKEIVKDYFDERLKGNITESLIDFVQGGRNAKTRLSNNMVAFSEFVDDVVEKVLNSGVDMGNFMLDLLEFEKVYELATETSTLGSTFLGLNQGIPTSKEDLLNKILQIQKAVSKREKKFNITTKNLANDKVRQNILAELADNNKLLKIEDINSALVKAEELGIVNNFNFVTWLENSQYRRATSDYYNIIKGTWNIFDIIDKLPHFNAIFKAFHTVLVMDEVLIKKSYILNTIVKDLFSNDDFIDSQTISKLLDYVDDLLILRWLNNKSFKMPIFNGDSIFSFNGSENTYKGEKPSSIVIQDEASRNTLKKIIEERLVPHLQSGYYYDVDENGNMVRIDLKGKNKFLDMIITDIDNDGRRYLKLDLDMLNTTSTVNNETRYQECLSDFIKLKNYKLGGMSVADWIMVYNLLVNKNKFGSDRMTTLFGLFIGIIKENSVIKSFLKDTGNFDFSNVNTLNFIEDLIEWGYNRDDALYKIAPIITKAQEANTKARMVKEYLDGRLVVKRRGIYGYGSKVIEIVPESASLSVNDSDSKLDLMIRYLNFMNYGTIPMPFSNKRASSITNISSGDLNLMISALKEYMKLGIVEIYTENC